MENKKQTAVEWFATQIMDNWNDITAGTRNIAEFIQQAKQMQKQQIIETARFYFHERGKAKPEEYYNQEYGS